MCSSRRCLGAISPRGGGDTFPVSTYLHTHSQQSKLLSFLPHFACFFIISGFLPIQNATELTVHYRPISLCLVSTLVRTRATCFHSFICPPFSLILYLLSSRDERQSVGPGCKKGEQRAVQGRGETMPGYSIITWHPSPSGCHLQLCILWRQLWQRGVKTSFIAAQWKLSPIHISSN